MISLHTFLTVRKLLGGHAKTVQLVEVNQILFGLET